MGEDNSTTDSESESARLGGPEPSPGASGDGRKILDYPPTRWTLVLMAVEGADARADQAVAELCEHYRSAIQGYFRIKCRNSHAAEDLASAFVLHLLEKNRFRNYARSEGKRFRNYLGKALKYFLLDHLPPKPTDPIEPHLENVGEDADVERHIDVQLALATHQRALAALRATYGRHGKAERVDRLQAFLLEDPEGDEYSLAAADLGLAANALHQAVFRLRNDYYEVFRAEVAQTVRHCKEELDDETRYLMLLLPAALTTRGGNL